MGQDRGSAAWWGSAQSCSAALPIPRFIVQRIGKLLKEVESVVRDLVCKDAAEDYVLTWQVYGVEWRAYDTGDNRLRRFSEAFILGECIAPRGARAAEVVRTTKQYLLHHGYEARLFTAGNLGCSFTPPEVSVGPAYQFDVDRPCGHVTLMRCFHLRSRRCSASPSVIVKTD